jgi:hypothetical protein
MHTPSDEGEGLHKIIAIELFCHVSAAPDIACRLP